MTKKELRGLSEEEVLRMSNNIKNQRTLAGLTQQQVANKLGLTLTGYNRWENKPNILTIDKLLMLARSLGCKLSDFNKDVFFYQ